jgi:cyclopropane fatty-acyl-phospholipid synthase-like methyltransferase
MLETIRSVLEFPWAYQLFFDTIGASERSRILVQDYIRPKPGDRVLEIGCGPGTILPYLPRLDYIGFDVSPKYISKAAQRFPEAKFVCERVSQYTLPHEAYFDIVLALGIVHHLDDSEATDLFRIGQTALKAGGRMITLDGCYTPTQSETKRYLLSRDRGQFVRTQDDYVKLAEKWFTTIEPHLREDLLRIPYTHLILECVR